MQDLKFHELANVFPLLANEQMQELAQDIKANGLREQITLFNGRVLDGRNRYSAAKIATFDLTPECFETFDGTTEDAIAFVISANIQRRHLTNDQRAQIAAELYEKLPKKKEGGDRKSLSQISDSDIPSADSQKQKVAKQMKVSVKGMERAAAIQNKDPNKAAEVKAGTKTIKEVEKEMKPAKPQKTSVPKPHPLEAEVLNLSDAGMTQAEIGAEIGKTTRAARDILERGLLRRQGELTITPDMLSLTVQQKLELAIKQHKAKLNAEFHAAVNVRVQEFLENTIMPKLRQEQAEARRIMEARKGILSAKDYKKIWACLHPDRVVDPERKPIYEEAFRLFADLEKLVLNEKDSPTHFAKVPTTPAEWEEMKRQAKERKAKSRTEQAVRSRQ